MAAIFGVTITLALLATFTHALPIDLNLTSVWQPGLGWEVTCLWRIPVNDTLQSVRLYNNGQQFMVYRPETHGPQRNEIQYAPDKVMNVQCSTSTPIDRPVEDRCMLLINPTQAPVVNTTYTCEVSGERPTFRIGKKDLVVQPFVPPADAIIVSQKHQDSTTNRVTMNCSSQGLPAPNLQWEFAGNKVQPDFTGRVWNATSKLWHSWSYISYSGSSGDIICVPETTYNNAIVKGKYAKPGNTARRLISTAWLLIVSALSLLS